MHWNLFFFFAWSTIKLTKSSTNMWYSGCVVIFPYISPNSPKSFGNIFPPATYWGNPATSWGMSSTPPDWENPAAVGKNKPNRMGHFMIFSIPSLQRVHIPPRRNAVKSSTQTCLDLVWDVLVGSLWSVFFVYHHIKNAEWLSLTTVQRYHTLDLPKTEHCRPLLCDLRLGSWAMSFCASTVAPGPWRPSILATKTKRKGSSPFS